MKTILMVATQAFDHREWLKARGFKFEHPEWRKLTSSNEEWIETQAHARGRFRLTHRLPGETAFDAEERMEMTAMRERIARHKAAADTEAANRQSAEAPSRDQFYVPGYTNSAAPKPHARYASAPFTGHQSGGPRLAGDERDGGAVYFAPKKKR